jgi:hypothetical protein
MLEARNQLATARSEGDKNFYESKRATVELQIDSLVYELYDLRPEEIAKLLLVGSALRNGRPG